MQQPIDSTLPHNPPRTTSILVPRKHRQYTTSTKDKTPHLLPGFSWAPRRSSAKMSSRTATPQTIVEQRAVMRAPLA